MSKSALITGINGQDGSYLAELLLEKGYIVYGILKRNSVAENQTPRLDYIYWAIKDNLFYADMLDMASLVGVLQKCEPDEIYNLGAQSHVRVSFDQPLYTVDVGALGTLRLLEAARQIRKHKEIRFYQASSSEMYGKVHEVPQSETTPFHPRSPYACAKVYSYYQTQNYLDTYGILYKYQSGFRAKHSTDMSQFRHLTRLITKFFR